MIALCLKHHAFADEGNYTKEELRKWKAGPHPTPPEGILPWNPSVAFIMFGGNYFITPFCFRVAKTEVFSLRLSRNGYLSVNAAIWDKQGTLVCRIEDNDIIPYMDNLGDLDCTAKGKEMSVISKENDSRLYIRFDRKEPATFLSQISGNLRKATDPNADILLSFIEGTMPHYIDYDGMVPTLTLEVDILGPGFAIRTINKGVELDFRLPGLTEKVPLTGRYFVGGSLKFNINESESIHLGIDDTSPTPHPRGPNPPNNAPEPPHT
jgi:hypothetical protein